MTTLTETTVRTLMRCSALVSSHESDLHTLRSLDDVARLVADFPTAVHAITRTDFDELVLVRGHLVSIWSARRRDETATLVNDLFEVCEARVGLDRAEVGGWRLDIISGHDVSFALQFGADAAMAVAELVVNHETQRLKRCGYPGCTNAFADLSKNRVRRYCDPRGCGNRANVQAYRARRAAAVTGGRRTEVSP